MLGRREPLRGVWLSFVGSMSRGGWLAVGLLLCSLDAAAVTCTWNGLTSTWDDQAAWSACAGGTGSNPNTPGPGDTAIINAGLVNVFSPEVVSNLQLNGGSLFIDGGMGGSLDVDTAFTWTGGTVDGFAGILTLLPGSTSVWNGADLTLLDSNSINIDGTVNWTAGLIHIRNAVISIGSGGIWNMDINGASVEAIDVPAPGTFAQILNGGVINKTGTQTAQLLDFVSLDGSGAFNLVQGNFELRAALFDGTVDVAAGTVLQIAGSTLFDAASFTGAGNVRFGTPAPSGCVATINGSYGISGSTIIDACDVGFGAAAVSFSNLQMLNPLGSLGGPAVMNVAASFVWDGGLLIGGPGEMLTIDSIAMATLGGPAGPPVRAIVGRTLVNDGTINVLSGNGLDLAATATLQNGVSGTISFNLPGAEMFVVTDDLSGNDVANAGALQLIGGQAVAITAPFVNDGTVTVNAGQLDLTGDGIDSGDYAVAASSLLVLSNGTRQVLAAGSVTGAGQLVVRDGATVDIDSSMTLPDLSVTGPMPAQLNYNNAGNLSLTNLAILDGSTLVTAAPIQVSGLATLDAGTLRAIAAVSLFVGAPAMVFLPGAPGSLFTFDDISFVLAGTANWQGGGIHLDNNADFQVSASGTLNIDSVTMMPQILGCSVCGVAPTLSNQGTITKTALGTGDDASINAPIQVINQGSLQVNGGVLSVASFNQNGGVTPSTAVNASAQLDFGAMTGQFSVGTLSGSGQILGDVNVNGATVQPGTVGPGQLSISGNYTQSAGSTLDVDLSGAMPGQFDQLQVGGSANVDGTVNVSQFGGFTPTPADVFPLVVTGVSLTAPATIGTNDFAGFDLQVNGNVLEFANVGGPLMLEVTSTADPGDGVCDLAGTGDGCTLREAIDAANANVGPDLITFNIVGAGVQTIAPLSPLPAITDETFIDGLSQPGALGNTNPADVGGFNGNLLIELSGQNTAGDGLVIDAGSNEVIILGLVINRWSGAGVRVNSTFAAPEAPTQPRAFAGIRAPSGVTATANIVGNYIGTSADGLSVPGPQTNGVVVTGPAINGTVFIGDGVPDGRNLISGNVDHGVVISADDVRLLGNLVGTDVSGLAPLGNGRRGVHLVGDNVVGVSIGGGMPASDRNIIAGNTEDGIGLQCAPASPDSCFDGTRIIGNYIGVGVDGLTPIPNANGINIIEMSFGLLRIGSLSVGEFNKIEFNNGAGVLAAPFAVMGSEAAEGRATISGNAFMGNGGPAIDLGADGRSGNDVGDTDGGFNNGQNAPSITNILFDTPTSGQTTLEYSVDTLTTEALYPLQVEFYRASGDEGLELLGTDVYLLAEAGTTKSFVLPGMPAFAPEDVVIATATDANGKTSEFNFYDVVVAITNDTPDPSIIGDPYTVEVTVTKVSGPFAPVGQVVVADGEPLPQTCGFALVVADGGVGNCLLNGPASTGTLNLMAAFDGIDTPFGGNLPELDPDGEPHTVGNPTSILISDAVDPTPVGEAFTLGVTVSAAVGTPTGTVDITSTGGESCSIPLTAGSGSCQLTPLTVGLRSLTATYTPDPGFDGSTASEGHDVVVAPSTTTILSDLPDPSSPGATVTVSVNVAPANAGNVLTPGGGVMVDADSGESCLITTLDPSGNGSCNLIFAAVGMRNLTATYAGSALFGGSASVAEPHDVQALPPEDSTTAILSATPTPSVVGQPYLVQVQVTGNDGGTPCGDVLLTQLPDGSTCNATLVNGASPAIATGSCQLTAPNAITKAITAVYTPGACNFNGSQAPLFTHAVQRASTTTTITSQSPNPSSAGQPVTVGFAVAVSAPGAGTPTGTVTVTDGIDLCQALLPATSCQLSFKTAGNRTLTVSYGGDADFNASGTSGTQQVNAAGSTVDLSIRKVNDRCTLPGGTRVTYLIEVRNLGPAAVTGARVVDTLQAPLSNATWTCTATSGSSCVAAGTGNINQLVNLQVDGVATFSLQVDVPATPETQVSNTATVTVPSGITDPVPGNNSSTDTDPIGVFCDGIEDALSD